MLLPIQYLHFYKKKENLGGLLSLSFSFPPSLYLSTSDLCLAVREMYLFEVACGSGSSLIIGVNLILDLASSLGCAVFPPSSRLKSLLWLIPSSADFVFYPSNGFIFPVSSFLSPLLVSFQPVQFCSPSSLASRDEIGLVLDRLAPCLFSRDWLSYWPSHSLLILRLPDDWSWFMFLQLFSHSGCLESLSSWFKLTVLIHYWRSLLYLWYLVTLSLSKLHGVKLGGTRMIFHCWALDSDSIQLCWFVISLFLT